MLFLNCLSPKGSLSLLEFAFDLGSSEVISAEESGQPVTGPFVQHMGVACLPHATAWDPGAD